MGITARIIGRSHFGDKAFSSFLRSEGLLWERSSGATAIEEIVEASGRICYMSFGRKQSPKTNREYIQHLIRMGHESVLEHVNWTLLLTGVSRGFTHQLVRHRVGFSFSQLSQQYHDETKAQFVEPLAIKLSPQARQVWKRSISLSKQAYAEILKLLHNPKQLAASGLEERELRRAARSAARSVLPNATETKIVMTANARAFRYFLRLRGSIPGDEEMRRVAAALLKQLRPEAPSIFFDFKVGKLKDGSPAVHWIDSREDK
jgi:thymidylate synthase (FAD)